jgi:uncharacterized MAPEG superfamily protein
VRGISEFRADPVEGEDWYKRAMRAHANCIENLPVFGAIVFALYVGNVTSDLVNMLAIAILIARVMQSLVHVCLSRQILSYRYASDSFFFNSFAFFG